MTFSQRFQNNIIDFAKGVKNKEEDEERDKKINFINR